MSSVLRPLTVAAIVGAAIIFLTPGMWAISPEAAEVQLQMAKLLFSDGRYSEAFDAFEQAGAGPTTSDEGVCKVGPGGEPSC